MASKNTMELLSLIDELIEIKCIDKENLEGEGNINEHDPCYQLLEIYFDIASSATTFKARDIGRKYEWVEKVISRGLPDGRKRFILYVLSAYLTNIKKLDDEEALEEVKRFLENSCRNYGNCEKIYESWIRSDLARVRRKGLKPARLEKLDDDLKEYIKKIL